MTDTLEGLNEEQKKAVTTTGTKVKHSLFGVGEILEVNESDGYYVVQFEGMRTARNISFKIEMERV